MTQEQQLTERFMGDFWDGLIPVNVDDLASNAEFLLESGEQVAIGIETGKADIDAMEMEFMPVKGSKVSVLALRMPTSQTEHQYRFAVAYAIACLLMATSTGDLAGKCPPEAMGMALDILMPRKSLARYAAKDDDKGSLAETFNVAPIKMHCQMQRTGLLKRNRIGVIHSRVRTSV